MNSDREVPYCGRCGGRELDLDIGAGRWFCYGCRRRTGDASTYVVYRKLSTPQDDNDHGGYGEGEL